MGLGIEWLEGDVLRLVLASSWGSLEAGRSFVVEVRDDVRLSDDFHTVGELPSTACFSKENQEARTPSRSSSAVNCQGGSTFVM